MQYLIPKEQEEDQIPITLNVLQHLLTFDCKKAYILLGTRTVTNYLVYTHAQLLYIQDVVDPLTGENRKAFTFNDGTSCYTTTIDFKKQILSSHQHYQQQQPYQHQELQPFFDLGPITTSQQQNKSQKKSTTRRTTRPRQQQTTTISTQ